MSRASNDTRTRKKPGTPAKRLDAKAAVDATSLIENQDFITDFARYSESILDEKYLRRKYCFDDSIWKDLGGNDELVSAIETERVKRMRNGDSAREKAQQIFVAAPSVLGGILNDNGANARHRIESAREIRAIASVGPESTPSADKFQIIINLGSDVERYSKFRAVGTGPDPDHDDADMIAIVSANKSTEGGGGTNTF
jgi:hypothetical protein